jgi:hypothetical protein
MVEKVKVVARINLSNFMVCEKNQYHDENKSLQLI